MMEPRICIIGAGISGLSVGYQLMKAGFRPVVFEKESFAGGRMSSERVEGYVIDKGAYTLPEFHRLTVELIREVGLESSLEETSGTSSTFYDKEAFPIKIGAPADFLKYGLLSFRNKRDLVKLFLYATSLGKALNLGRPTEKSFELETETTARYLLREYDEEVLEKIAYPIFCEIFLGTPETNSKLAFLSTIRNLTSFKIFSLREGLGSLAEALRRKLDVRFHSPVLQVRATADDQTYTVSVGGDRPQSFTFHTVVFAIPAPLVPSLLPDIPESVREGIGKVVYAASMVVVMGVDQPLPGTSFINNLSRRNFRILATLVVDHHKGPARIPAGKGLVTAILRDEASRALSEQSDGTITAEVLKETGFVFPGFSEHVIFSRVYRWPYGAVQLTPGALRQQISTRKAWEECFPSLYLVSDDLRHSSVETQVRAGIDVAEKITRKYQG